MRSGTYVRDYNFLPFAPRCNHQTCKMLRWGGFFIAVSATEALNILVLLALLHSLTKNGSVMTSLSAHAASLSTRTSSISTTNRSISVANSSQTSNVGHLTNGIHLSCRGALLGFNLDVESCRSALRSIDVTEQTSISWGPRTTPRLCDVPLPHRWVAGKYRQTERGLLCY